MIVEPMRIVEIDKGECVERKVKSWGQNLGGCPQVVGRRRMTNQQRKTTRRGERRKSKRELCYKSQGKENPGGKGDRKRPEL